MTKEVVYKPSSKYSKTLDKQPETKIQQGVVQKVYILECPDHSTVTQTVTEDFIIFAINIWASSTAVGGVVSGLFSINNYPTLSMRYTAEYAQYIQIPLWLIRQGSTFKLTVDHDPAEADTIHIDILGYYA